MDPTDVTRERRVSVGLAVLFATVAVLSLLDLFGDLREGPGHALLEAAITVVGASGLVWAVRRGRRLLATSKAEAAASRERAREAEERAAESDAETAALAARLAESRAEAARWKGEAATLIGGLGAAIDRQLDRWGLSPAEKEIALLLLKGLSHKDVAELRSVGETTVRQQARSIYKKGGLEGRHDLAAFFLEDLLTPRPAEARHGTSRRE
jgi:DNA-binding CsgD family transcriptional regulator